MNISKEIKKSEAIKRMKALGIYSETIKQFKEDNLISCSEPPLGANYWINDEQKEIIKALEEEYNALAYFVIRSYTQFGKLDSILCVSDYKEEWDFDNSEIKHGYVFAYVHNYDVPEFSEFGSIVVQERFGGLVRIG